MLRVSAFGAFAALFLFSPGLGAVTIDTVLVGNPGNASSTVLPVGAVPYSFRIGTYEVTNSQYAEFLNAKAVSDPLGLYNPNMDSDPRGGITRAGASGSYSYSVKPNMGDKPVNYVNFYDSLRFTNWMNNGQGSSTTETGAYKLTGNTPTPGSVSNRLTGATWFLPNYDEWYKAAFHDPRDTAQGGPAGNSHYWSYATQSSVLPLAATADIAGNISNPGANVANYNFNADWNGQDGNLTTVGSAGLASRSFYGTADQSGNAFEWNGGEPTQSSMLILGGGWNASGSGISAAALVVAQASNEFNTLGFRLATVPEPSALILAAAAMAGLGVLRWRRNP